MEEKGNILLVHYAALVELVFFELFVDDQLMMMNYYYFQKKNSYIFRAVVIMVNEVVVVVSYGIYVNETLLIVG